MNDFTKTEKKKNGIYFTPKQYRESIFILLDKYLNNNKNIDILEPSFGSGEFIIDCCSKYKNSNITGIEINKKIFDNLNILHNKIKLYNEDYILFNKLDKYDLIIGNPPYIVIKKDTVPNEYKSIIYGRPNIFCLFIFKSIKLLKENGIIAFILPNSFLNTSYYEKIRKNIHETCNILEIIEFNDKKFFDTTQDTICIILQKSKDINNKYVINYNNKILFNINYEYIKDKLNRGKNLNELGYGVKTGTITWNEEKNNLTDNENTGTILIYNSNLKKELFNNVNFLNNKKQYIISKKKKEIGPAILINRGHGNSSYIFNVLFIEENKYFYAENHINIVYCKTEESKKNIYNLYKYLISDQNKKYISFFSKNGALSKTEVEYFIPIY